MVRTVHHKASAKCCGVPTGVARQLAVNLSLTETQKKENKDVYHVPPALKLSLNSFAISKSRSYRDGSGVHPIHLQLYAE